MYVCRHSKVAYTHMQYVRAGLVVRKECFRKIRKNKLEDVYRFNSLKKQSRLRSK